MEQERIENMVKRKIRKPKYSKTCEAEISNLKKK